LILVPEASHGALSDGTAAATSGKPSANNGDVDVPRRTARGNPSKQKRNLFHNNGLQFAPQVGEFTLAATNGP
jgi:hypothetical protein